MTDATPRHNSAPVPIGDVVPGDPPVPITVWNLAPPHSGETLSNAMGVRLIANYTHISDLIIDLTDGPQLARGIIAAGRRILLQHHATLHHGGEQAALIVTGWPAPDAPAEQFLAECRQRLLPGGCVAAVMATPDPMLYADLVATAREHGLVYLQHIVAATGLGTPTGGLDANRRSLRVHTDILVLAAPREDGRR
ncbi:hypothetical protein [Catellatospora chokoriensis]|uniref:Uncharacterized protein n=1 Tax=Catellatospora chokoriensis TaxID=310353 RepID=A0A8J3JZC9_9ACTN|nr:hypothetical protein [Catellatospora chokoriensis]GIF89813.1 hypothetical protein Cch02nite_32570 [Catellatospora chokoriensis]